MTAAAVWWRLSAYLPSWSCLCVSKGAGKRTRGRNDSASGPLKSAFRPASLFGLYVPHPVGPMRAVMEPHCRPPVTSAKMVFIPPFLLMGTLRSTCLHSRSIFLTLLVKLSTGEAAKPRRSHASEAVALVLASA